MAHFHEALSTVTPAAQRALAALAAPLPSYLDALLQPHLTSARCLRRDSNAGRSLLEPRWLLC